MKGRNLILTGLIALVVGLLLILFRDSLANGGVVIAGGILFVVAGVLNMTVFLASRDKQGRAHLGAFGTAFGWIASAAAVVLGLAMLIFSHVFVAIVGFMFAVLLLFGALFQIFLILFGARPVSLSRWFFLVPTALIGAALFIFLRKPDTVGEHTIMLLTGIGLGIFGLFTIIEGCAIGQENHRTLRESRAAAKPSKNTIEEPVKEAVKEPVKDEAPVAEQDEKKDS
ncbi:MAG: DUF308 domain-containing protein [Muribaculaceae bacterium]|nr:DUF308 domain-containing protein [Muribaculaceae bacterium]